MDNSCTVKREMSTHVFVINPALPRRMYVLVRDEREKCNRVFLRMHEILNKLELILSNHAACHIGNPRNLIGSLVAV